MAYRRITKGQERLLLERAQRGDQAARDELVMRNTGMVWAVIRKTKRTYDGMEPDDLYIEGCTGLIRAIDRFNLTQDVRFSTYAYDWVRQHINRAIENQGRMIRLPTHVSEKLWGLSEGELPAYALPVYSLDHLVSAEGPERSLADFVVDDSDPFEAAVIDRLEWEGGAIMQAVRQLPEREQQIIRLHHGLDDGMCWSLAEIGAMFDPPITREAVRQREVSALRRIRNMLAKQAERDNHERDDTGVGSRARADADCC